MGNHKSADVCVLVNQRWVSNQETTWKKYWQYPKILSLIQNKI